MKDLYKSLGLGASSNLHDVNMIGADEAGEYGEGVVYDDGDDDEEEDMEEFDDDDDIDMGMGAGAGGGGTNNPKRRKKEGTKGPAPRIPKNLKSLQVQLVCDSSDIEGVAGMREKKVRELDASQVEKLVVVNGIVVQVKNKIHKARRITVECWKCKNKKVLMLKPGLSGVQVPTYCDNFAMFQVRAYLVLVD